MRPQVAAQDVAARWEEGLGACSQLCHHRCRLLQVLAGLEVSPGSGRAAGGRWQVVQSGPWTLWPGSRPSRGHRRMRSLASSSELAAGPRPQGTDRPRLSLVCHGHGSSGWFRRKRNQTQHSASRIGAHGLARSHVSGPAAVPQVTLLCSLFLGDGKRLQTVGPGRVLGRRS